MRARRVLRNSRISLAVTPPAYESDGFAPREPATRSSTGPREIRNSEAGAIETSAPDGLRHSLTRCLGPRQPSGPLAVEVGEEGEDAAVAVFAVGDVELGEDVADVGFHGAFADHEPVGDG